MKNIYPILFSLFLFTVSNAVAQIKTFDNKKAIEKPTDQWHKIRLEEEVFGSVNPNLNDIRIYGIKENKDTIEVPYVIDISREIPSVESIDLGIINRSNTSSGHFFTLKSNKKESIDHIHLDFRNRNFDWKIKLEGSQNQSEWFTILNDYRILSIHNSQTDYSFTELDFDNSVFKYYRLQILNGDKPILQEANRIKDNSQPAVFNTFAIDTFTSTEDKKSKTTVVHVNLKQEVPISFLDIDITEEYDYYRPVTIKYLLDSTKTPKGTWIHNYKTIYRGTLSSFEQTAFMFDPVISNKLRIEISNYDNTPLTIKDVTVKGYEYQLMARFTEPANYFLVYGNKQATKPQYDIQNTKVNIPDSLTFLTLGKTQTIEKPVKEIVQPMFENPAWLWAVLGFIVLLLGWFALRMMKAK